MFITHKICSGKGVPLIKTGKLAPDQAVALLIIAFGMLGFVATYISVANRIASYFQPMQEAIEEYRENVDRYSDTPQVVIPLWDSVLYILAVCFLVPVTEEMTFRGVIYGQLRRGFGPWPSIIISALFFGIMHGVSIHIGYALVCGILIAACYYLTDSIYASILLHVVFNIFGSGIANTIQLEQLHISDEVTGTIITGINVTSILFMPMSVIAFAYLVSSKRKKAADKKKVEEYKAAHEGGSLESDTGDNMEETVDAETSGVVPADSVITPAGAERGAEA